MKVRSCIFALIFAVAHGASAREAKPLAAVRLSFPDQNTAKGRQFVQADREGRVFLLLGESLDVYQVLSSGSPRHQGRLLEGDASLDRPVMDAAMSLAGDSWVVSSIPNHLEILRGGKRAASMEAPWMVAALTASSGEPVVALLPAEMATAAPESLRMTAPPLLQSWDGKRWNTLAEGSFPGDRPDGVNRPEQLRGEFGALLSASPERHLWLADEHAYRLRHFSPSGMLKEELKVGDARVRWRERTKEEWTRAESSARQAGLSFNQGSLSSLRAEDVILGMTAARDGALYLLVVTERGLALDRFRPALLTLDRAALPGIGEISGRATLALGAGGLVIASSNPREGLWYIDQESLETTDWEPVASASVNGTPLLVTKAVPEQERPTEVPKKKSRVREQR